MKHIIGEHNLNQTGNHELKQTPFVVSKGEQFFIIDKTAGDVIRITCTENGLEVKKLAEAK